MGYESKIYIVEKTAHSFRDDTEKSYAYLIAMLDMSKCYPLSDVLRRKPETDCYFYDGADDPVIEDCYGKPLTECSIPDAIAAVEKAMAAERNWRYDILLSTLRAIESAIGDPSDFSVLHYGY